MFYRYVRKHWLDKLQLEFPIQIYRFTHGNSLGTMTFIWQLPSESPEDPTLTAKAITTLSSQQKLFCTRQMRKDFLTKYRQFVKAPVAVLRHLYKDLIHDCSAVSSVHELAMEERVAQAIIEIEDPEIILDLRRNNGKVGSSYEDFWEELQKYLDEIVTPVNERRHGTTMYLPIAISIRDLREQICDRLTKKFPDESKPIPSDEWIRLQFWPKNPYSSGALRYTGRFQVKYAVQARQMRKSHPDSKYVAVILQYVKSFAVQYRNHVLLLSVDDKAIVPVGEPEYPISTGVRGHHRSLAFTSLASGPTLSALDHDFHLFGIVPSVSLAITIPDSFNDSFFSGQPYVCNKDKITQPSSPCRHSAELVQLVKDISFDEGGCKPLLIILSDGGPDHRLCYWSVKVSMIALFLNLNLDMLVCMQMCPYQSWTNPAERVMSTLNLALQNVSLMREKMDDEMERAIKHKNNISAIRDAFDETPGLSEAVRESTSSVISLLNERFSRMKLKGNPIIPRPAASQDDVVDNFESVHFIDSSVQMRELNQASLKNAKDLHMFMKAHCNSTHYLFQVKKCGEESCFHCGAHPIRLTEQLKDIHFVPLPVLDSSKNHYKKFGEIYGQLPSEVDRPSLTFATSEAKACDKENRKLLVASKVRAVLVCVECMKPRCVYAAGALTPDEKRCLKPLINSRVYSCGCELFPPEHPLHSSVIVRQAINCSDPMEAQYYSATCMSFPPVCWFCGSPEEVLAEDELVRSLKDEYAVVRPICFLCRSDGKRPATWGASNVAKRAKH